MAITIDSSPAFGGFGIVRCWSFSIVIFALSAANVFAASDMVNPAEQGRTFYRQFFIAGGPIVWFVLLPMSVVAVYLAIDLLFSTRRKRLLPGGVASDIATDAVIHGHTLLLSRLAGRSDLISRAILRAIEQARHIGGNAQSIRQFAAEALQERGMQLMRKAQWCQVIGSVAPMVGLFGTVYGMIRAFNLLGQGTEGPRYELLAEAISIALVTTFWGLLVAIPALFLYGFFQTRIESLVSEAAMETEAVLGRLLKEGTTILFRRDAESVKTNESGRAAAAASQKGTILRRKQSPQNQPISEQKTSSSEPQPSSWTVE